MGGRFDRRAMLKAIGAVGASGALAGCPTDSTGSTTPPTDTPTAPQCSSYTTLDRSDVNGGATIDPGCYRIESVHTVDSGTLTLRPGVVIEFDADAGLHFATDDDATAPARLETKGTDDDLVFLTGRTEQRGFWKGIRFDDGTSTGANAYPHELHGVVVEHAGSELWHGADYSRAGVFVQDAAVEFADATLRDNRNWALSAPKSDAALSIASTTFASNEGAARVHANLVGGFEDTVSVRNNDDDRITTAGATGSSDTISTDQTWVDPGVPYHVPRNLATTAHLTVENGTTIEFDQNKGLDVNGGVLTVNGQSNSTVQFTADGSGAGSWAGIRFRNTDSSDNVLEHALVIDAGGHQWHGADHSAAGVFVQGDDVSVRVSDCKFLNNAVSGLTATGSGWDLTVEDCNFGANEVPITVDADLADGLAASNSFLGNDNAYVAVGTSGSSTSVSRDATWAALDVPYRLTRNFDIDAPLEIDPGVTVEVEAEHTIEVTGGYLLADASGSNDPITFTGAEKTAGHWGGIGYEVDDPNNKLKNVVVEYGGGHLHTGDTDTKANLVVGRWGDGISPELELSDATIRESGKHGLYRYDAAITCSNVTYVNNANADIYDGQADGPASGC